MKPFLTSGFSFGGPLEAILDPKLLPEIPCAPRFDGLQDSSSSDAYFMNEALLESLKSVGICNPNPAVGCILLNSKGHEVSRGFTQAYRGFHAERCALAQLKNPKEVEGGTAYVTLEPCSHQGHQPPCVDQLIEAGIRRVVIARQDPNPMVCGAGIKRLQSAGVTVVLGVRQAEATAWNFPFLAHQHLKRPVFILKWAQSLDGQLADDSGQSQWITQAAARSYTHWLRQKYDAILVGAQTVLSDHPSLTVRDCALPHQAQPIPMVFDPRGLLFRIQEKQRLQLETQLFAPARPILLLTSRAAAKAQKSSWLNRLENVTVMPLKSFHPEGINAMIQTDHEWIQELTEALMSPRIMSQLKKPIQSVLVEGGAKTLRLFLQADCADLLHVFVAPILLGGQKNRIHLMRSLKQAQKFELISTHRLGSDTVLELIHPQHTHLFK
ncbi:MAG: bifunctional diaminohydroxyphosphoribosylaminopyrimidine deaminase/5-amino-6-(5-phosphoribosylamino)uracil reductase RibD [Bdellovibrionia bacterium]